jgi:hypothetical protein
MIELNIAIDWAKGVATNDFLKKIVNTLNKYA